MSSVDRHDRVCGANAQKDAMSVEGQARHRADALTQEALVVPNHTQRLPCACTPQLNVLVLGATAKDEMEDTQTSSRDSTTLAYDIACTYVARTGA